MVDDILKLRDVTNWEIMNAVRNDASLDYQRRIPEVTQATVNSTVALLRENRPAWNEFLNGFINRIGMVFARSQMWENPLGVFKKGMLTYGDTVEEYMAGLLEAYGYDPDRDYGEKILFGQERPQVEVNYHKINRQDFYKITVNDKMLRRAFLSEDGLSRLIRELLDAPLKSDQWDEFLLMSDLFAKNEANGGFFKVQVPDFANLSTETEAARGALKTIKSLAYKLPFLSTNYNAARMPVAANPEDLVLIGTPDFLASIDVDGLAPIFHLDKAKIVAERTIPMPQEYLKINGAQGVLTTKDFFMVFDTLIENRMQPNPAGLYDNYFMHHHQIISLSRFVPAILLTSESGTITIRKEFTVDSVAAPVVTASDGTTVTKVERGLIYDLEAPVTTTPTGVEVGVAYSIAGQKSPRTYVTNTGVLYVAPNEAATSITVVAHTTNIDPANPRLDPKTAQAVLTVEGEIAQMWPAGGALYGIKLGATDVVGVTPATTTYTVALPAGSTLTKGDVMVLTQGSPDVEVTVTKVAGGYTVKIDVDEGAGAAKVYTLNVTVSAA